MNISVFPAPDVTIGSPLDYRGDLRTAAPSIIEELLSGILTEMQVHSIYLNQLPLVLNEGKNFEDEPRILREELTNEK